MRSMSVPAWSADTYDNLWDMPYNAYLLLQYNAHINVEYCVMVKAIKYLNTFFKSHDSTVITITPDTTSLTVNDSVTDEIRNYIDCHYIGAMEAVWCIFHFQQHDRHPAVQVLDVHRKYEQRVIFSDS